MSKENPCEQCTNSYVGCKFACLKIALADENHKDHELALFMKKEHKKLAKSVSEAIVRVEKKYREFVDGNRFSGTRKWRGK